ncbi:MAG TPA: polymer-forming cytoskeletal protein [Kofleriaceae bacterium]|nr:polymer-forming cytoskeletal protein [Kofleriaceae bacterium]
MPDQLAVIPRETRVDGLIETPHDLLVEGQVDGRIQVGGTLTVARGATCRASVRARAAVVSGEIFGDLVCTATIAVAAGGRVVGDMRAPEIDVDAAAEVDGRVDLLPPAPASSPLRRVAVRARGPGVRRPMPPLPVTEIGHRG